MSRGLTQNIVRCLVALALCAALTGSVVAPAPENLPTIALGQTGLYRLEIALLVFYGSLALLTPAFSALAWGRLPVEISTRGARFADEADRWAGQHQATIKALQKTTKRLSQGLATASMEIDRLKAEDVTKHDQR